MARRVYWDSCVFLGLISKEAGKVAVAASIWQEAMDGDTEILTSVFTFTEVIRARCEGKFKPLPEADDKPIVDFLSQKHVTRLLLDEWTANSARRLLRQYIECKKPADGVHLATALQHNADEMHTWDGSDLLGLDGKVMKKNGIALTICRPRIIAPPPTLSAAPSSQTDLALGP